MDDSTMKLVIGVLVTVAAGGWTLAAYLIRMYSRLIMSGQLVPRSTLEDALDATKFKDQEILTVLATIKTNGVETGQTLHKFIDGLQRVLRTRPLDEGDGR